MAENPFGTSTEVVAVNTALVSVEQQRAIAEVQARMIMARANPRDPMRAMDQILQDCTRVSLAESAVYQYARGGTDITGPSIRLAESIARRWGNIHAGIRELDRRDGFSECSAFCWDLETGYFEERQFRVRHWRDTKGGGYRVTDERDIYEMIASSAQRRKRAVILSVIPGDVIEAAVQQCEETLHTKADTSPEAIRKMIDAFAEFGVTQAQIEARCQRRAEAIRPAQIVMLRRIYSSLKDEMSAPSDWFEAAQAPPSPLRGNEALRSRLTPAEPPPAPDEPEPMDEEPPVATRSRGRPRKRQPLEVPTEAEIERSQEMIEAVLGPEELPATIDPSVPEQTFDPEEFDAPAGPPVSVFVPFDAAGGNMQEWFSRARGRLHEMQRAEFTPEQFQAYRKANAGALMRLRAEYISYWQQLENQLLAGERQAK